MAISFKMPSLPRKALTLVIGDDGTILYGEGVRGARGLFTPSFDDPATARIVERLRARPRATVAILLDVLEQSYKRETVPKVGMLDRPKVIRRRLELAFPISPLRGYSALPPDKANPRQLNLLLVGAAQSEQLGKWLDLMATLPNPIGGIAALPLESVDIGPLLVPGRGTAEGRADAPFVTLVTWNRVGGFRQIVSRNNELVFTRMTPGLAPDTDGAEIAASLEREFRATLGYLGRLGFGEGQILQVVTVLPERAREAVGRLKIAGFTPTFLTPGEAGRKLGLGAAVAGDDQHADLLHGAWYTRKTRPAISMLPANLQQRRNLEHSASWTKRAAAAVAVGALGYAGWLGFGIVTARMDFEDIRTRTELARRLDKSASDALARFPASLAAVTGVVAITKQLDATIVEPWPLLEGVASALLPDVRLGRIVWRLEPPSVTPLPPSAPRPPLARAEGQVLLYDPDIDRVEAVRLTRTFGERLQVALPRMTISITRFPVDILPGQSFSNSTVEQERPFGSTFNADFTVVEPRRP